MNNLFRKEVQKTQVQRLSGTVLLSSPLGFRLIVLVGLFALVLLVVFAATATYTRKETVSGWLSPDTGLIRVAAQRGGILEEISVAEGASIEVGQVIAVLRLSSSSRGGDSYSALNESLQTQVAASEAQAGLARDKLLAEEAQLTERRTALRAELAEAARRIELQQQRVVISNAELARLGPVVEKGFLPRRDFEARQSAALGLDQELSSLRASALALEREIAEVSARLGTIPADLRAADVEASMTSAGLSDRRITMDSESSYAVVSTVAGNVSALPVRSGQTVQPGASVAVLTPRGSKLEAELYVPSRAAGFIRAGQDVRLMYQAFPHQKFGVGHGTVSSVSRTVLSPDEVAMSGVELNEPVFRVRVSLKQGTVAAYGAEVPLQPGMLLSADIVVDRRTLFEWLLDPLYAIGRR